MNITDRCAAALDLRRRTGLPLDDPATTPTHLRRYRARIARHVTAMLGVDPASVHVGDDPARGTIAPGHLVTVQDDLGTLLRFIPETGDDELFLLLRPCPRCDGEVPVARVAGLVDLGRHLERDADPDDRPGPMPVEFELDPGHATDCDLRHRPG